MKVRIRRENKDTWIVDPQIPLTVGDVLFTVIALIVIGCVIGLFLLFRIIGSANFEYHVLNALTILTKWFIVAIVVGVTVFLVSIKNSAGTVTAIIEAILAACAYHIICLAPLPGPIGNLLERFVTSVPDWVGLFLIPILLLPRLIDTIFLAIGSANNTELRNGYIKMNNIFYYITVGIITIILSIEGAAEFDAWGSFWLMLFTGILVLISAWIYAKIERLILRSGRRQ